MKALKLKNERLQLLILGAPFCAAALLWDKVPDRVPIHWNIHDQVDGYAGKTFGVLFLPLVNLVCALILDVLPLIDPKMRNYQTDIQASVWRIIRILRLAITGFLALVSLAILASGLGMQVNVGEIISIGAALLLIVAGNFVGKLRPNYFAGFRTPWTLESPTVWAKTHRLGGFMMVGCGICMLLFCFLLRPEHYLIWVAAPCIVAMAGVPLVYSYVIYQAERKARAS
jgi:uncharacterized membrane protein